MNNGNPRCRLHHPYISTAQYRVDVAQETERNEAKYVAWPSCAWLLLSFFPFPVLHPLHPVFNYKPFEEFDEYASARYLRFFANQMGNEALEGLCVSQSQQHPFSTKIKKRIIARPVT